MNDVVKPMMYEATIIIARSCRGLFILKIIALGFFYKVFYPLSTFVK